MKLEERKLAIYEELVHGDSIKLRELYDVFLPCCVKTGKVYLSSDIILMHDVSDLNLPYKTLLLSINQLPILTTSTTQELISEYDEARHCIFSRVTMTIRLYYGLKRKRYKNPLVDKELAFIPLNGSVRKEASFINPMYVNSIHKGREYGTVVNFMNFLSVDLDCDIKVLKNRMSQVLEHYFLYFYPESYDVFQADIYWKGKYLAHHKEEVFQLYQTLDDEWLGACKNKVEYFHHVKKHHHTLTIQEFISEYDSYWDIK